MTQNGIETLGDWFGRSLINVGDVHVTVGSALLAVLCLGLGFWIGKVVERLIRRLSERQGESHHAPLYLLARFSFYGLTLLGVLLGLNVLGISLTSLTVIAGALSVGIGFGLQSIFNNLVSGIIILMEQSIKVGDFIELEAGLMGTVKAINIRSTLINTTDNLDILIPNSEFVSGRVTNWTLQDVTRRLRVPFGVAYGSDKEKVRDAALEAAARVPMTLETPAPDVWLVNFGDSSLDFQLVVWVNPRLNTKPGGLTAAYLWEIETALRRHGIEIPFPQRDVHVRTLPPDARAPSRGDDAPDTAVS